LVAGTCEDGNGHAFYSLKIEFTGFPLVTALRTSWLWRKQSISLGSS